MGEGCCQSCEASVGRADLKVSATREVGKEPLTRPPPSGTLSPRERAIVGRVRPPSGVLT